MSSPQAPWYKELTRYHWFVFVVAALGWLFDTMDQQLFTLARAPAMQELLKPSPTEAASPADVNKYGPWATSVFLIGWATGGLGFGILGDRIGRAKTMMLTILVYSICTGLSAFSVAFWDFALWRFLTGLGVGGEFAVGVALVAEVMPDRARPFALGLLQALSAVGNVSAALISLGLGEFEQSLGLGNLVLFGFHLTKWRLMFMIGTLPALLALLIRRRLKEPERWAAVSHEEAAKKQLGSFAELFGDPRWRNRALMGMVLASSGVIGLWGIGFFTVDLNRSVFRKVFEAESRAEGEAEKDRDFVRLALQFPDEAKNLKVNVPVNDLLTAGDDLKIKDAAVIYGAIMELANQGASVSAESVLALLDKANEDKNRKAQSAAERERRSAYLAGPPLDSASLPGHAERIVARSKNIDRLLTRWAAYTSLMLNIGAFFGIYSFSRVTHYTGRRPAFAMFFFLGGLSTALVFWFINSLDDVFWMIPLMGFCQLSVFGGYAIYFPELFPTRLRSTGTSFCYNVGRFVAAIGPYTLGHLASNVFGDKAEPYRYAGVTMCSIFLLGILVLPFAPETKGQPLPE